MFFLNGILITNAINLFVFLYKMIVSKCSFTKIIRELWRKLMLFCARSVAWCGRTLLKKNCLL